MEWKNAHVMLQKELDNGGGLKTDSEDQEKKDAHVMLQKEPELFDSGGGLQTRLEDQEKTAAVMKRCDNRITALKKAAQRQQCVIEEYEKAIQSGELQGCGQQDVGKQADLPRLQEQYGLLQQQLKAVQMELLPGKSSKEAYAKFYGL